MALGLFATRTQAQTFPRPIARPNSRGDQVIFYYDVRENFTTFLNVRNVGSSALHVNVVFYSGDFTAPFAQDVDIPVAPGDAGKPATGGVVTIDVGALKASGLAAQPGVAIATAVDANGQPVVTRSLAGNFTVANLLTGSAWGSSGAARSAVQNAPQTGPASCPVNPPPPAVGAVIDGTTVGLAPIQPGSADLASYYDPAMLAPADMGGNQLIFITFEDVPGVPYQAKAAETTWSVTALHNTGAQLAPTKVTTSGVLVSDLATVAGAEVAGSSGSVLFAANAATTPLTRLVFFTETLGTFGTGYLLPRK